MTSPIPTNESQLLKEALLSIETASRPASAFVDPDIEVISRYNAELIIKQAFAHLSAKPDRQEGTGEDDGPIVLGEPDIVKVPWLRSPTPSPRPDTARMEAAAGEKVDAHGTPVLGERHAKKAAEIYKIAWNAIVDECADLDEGSVIHAIALELHDYGSHFGQGNGGDSERLDWLEERGTMAEIYTDGGSIIGTTPLREAIDAARAATKPTQPPAP